MVEEVLKGGLNSSNSNYLNFTANFVNGASVSKNDKISANSRQKIKVRVEVKSIANLSSILNTNLSFQINYSQADENAKEPVVDLETAPILYNGSVNMMIASRLGINPSTFEILYLDDSIRIPEGVNAVDVSYKQNGSVMAYSLPNSEDSSKNDIYIKGKGHLYANPNSENAFRGSAYREIVGAEKLNMSLVTNMAGMFANCTNLTKINTSTWNLSNVTTMKSAFGYSTSLQSIDASHWNLSNVTGDGLDALFMGCTGLISIDASHWNLEKTTNMNSTFEGCSSLETLNISNWNTANVTNWSRTFYGDVKLKNIDLSQLRFDSIDLNSFSDTFRECHLISGTLNINGNFTYTDGMTYGTSMFTLIKHQNSEQIVLNYTSNTERWVDDLVYYFTHVNTEVNVVKGSLIS